ncbi:YihY/virulence factor BrkB family protein [Halorientalis sp.]|uniref:YihY/virulence factor BrkB family protein n=1 Tax=Halorientalis sp. TaxID=1931229 RepID=UPI0026080095|nr:YihY/virulence factor BrkB family protein [Halorientalis sp.]
MPLSLLTLVVASVLSGETLAEPTVARLGSILSPSGEQILLDSLTGASGRAGATVAGVAVLVWGALKLFRGLKMAFWQVYGTAGSSSFVGQVTDATVALVAVGAAVGVAAGVDVLVEYAPGPLADAFGTPVLALTLAITFLPLYVILPDEPVGVREAVPGAALAGGSWALLSTVFRLYAESVGRFQLYGVTGGVLLLVTWFYVGSLVPLAGVVSNAVLADRDGGNRQLQQEPPRGVGQRGMSDEHGGAPDDGDDGVDANATAAGPDEESDVADELAELRSKLDAVEADIDDRTVHREEIERDLKRYVRRRGRRGRATGWGPYLVLLYGTAMTIGAFYFLGGGWAILAMLVIWLSTLGLYALMILVGVGVTMAGLPGRLRNTVDEFRS